MVGEKSLADMGSSDAVRLLNELQAQLSSDETLRLDISYKIVRLEDEPQ
jgi:hypothetical protein